jgi:lysophospholipase L1-like esterase
MGTSMLFMRFFCAFLLPLALIFNAHAQTPPTDMLVKDGQTVVFLGDSITGLGWMLPGGFLHLITDGLAANGVKITPICAGVAGNRSPDMLARVDGDVISKKPDWMLLSCGVNDVWSKTIELDAFKTNITAIVDKAQAAGIKVMILTPTPINETSTEFNPKLAGYVDFMKQIAKDRNLPCADVNAAWVDYLTAHPDPANHTILTADGVHPNADGYQLFAKTILAAFGATPNQLATADKAWRAAPLNAVLTSYFGFHAHNDTSVPPDELAVLNKMAADQKVELKKFVSDASLETARELLLTEDMSKVTPDDLSDKFDAGVIAKLSALTKMPADAPGPRSPIIAVAQFGITLPIPLSEWDALKKVAAARKVLLSQVVTQYFIEAVREALVAQGDLTKVWQDNISGSAGPILKSKLDAIAVKEGGWTPPANP